MNPAGLGAEPTQARSVATDLGANIDKLGAKIGDSGTEIVDQGAEIVDSGAKIVDLGAEIRDSGAKIGDVRSQFSQIRGLIGPATTSPAAAGGLAGCFADNPATPDHPSSWA